MAARSVNDRRPWTFYLLAALFGAYLLFLYGPMAVIAVLSFQGPTGGLTFPMTGVSLDWFYDIFRPGMMANIPVSFSRSLALAAVVSISTVVMSVAAGLAFRKDFRGAGAVFYLAVASLVMPSLLVGFGIGLGFQFIGIEPSLFTSALAAQLTWTLPFGMFLMFAVINRFNRSWEEAATDLGANAWQRFRYVTLPMLRPAIVVVSVLNALYALRVFDIVFALTNGGPGYATETIATDIFKSFSEGQYGLGTAVSTILFIILLVVGYFVIRLLERGQARD